MKKIFFISIIVVVFISLFLIRFTYLAKEPFNYGEDWNSRFDYERWIYLDGFMDGSIDVYFKVVDLAWELEPELMPSEFNKIMSKLLKFGKDLEPPETSNLFFIISTMTEWYKDSANAYIPFAKMFHIAKEKLKGMPIEKLLEEERRKAY